MNLQETKALLTLISVRDHRKIDDAVVIVWHDDLDQTLPFDTACRIVSDFFSDPDMTGEYLDARCINRAWRDMSGSSRPSEGQIAKELKSVGLEDSVWGAWMYRRQRLRGKTMEHSFAIGKIFEADGGLDAMRCDELPRYDAMHSADVQGAGKCSHSVMIRGEKMQL